MTKQLSGFICQLYRDIAENRYRRLFTDSIGKTCDIPNDVMTYIDASVGGKADSTGPITNWDKDDQANIVEGVINILLQRMRAS